MTNIRLSICIPVYNCGDFLPAALASILPQCGQDAEVVVFDGGSTDDTPAVMQRFDRPCLRYVRAPAKGGIDADLATCVSHARGEFCWLFSGDDVMRPGSVARAMDSITGGADVLLCRHAICDIGMKFMFDHVVLLPASEFVQSDLTDAGQRREWFARAASTEAFFSFISGIVIRKSTWDRGRMDPRFATSCWAHVVRIFTLAPQGLRVAYIPEIWLDQRAENDSFARAGVVNRFRIAIQGYHAIGDAVFGRDSVEAFHIRRVLRNEFTLRMFLYAKTLCRDDPVREDRQLLDSLYRQLHCDRTPRSLCLLTLYRLIPAWAAAVLGAGVRGLRRLRPASR